jgi:hypothetical protein
MEPVGVEAQNHARQRLDDDDAAQELELDREGGRQLDDERQRAELDHQRHDLRHLGGIIIIQTLPSVILGLYTNRLHPWALLIGWAVGIGSGTAMAASLAFKVSIYPIHLFGLTIPCYAALSSLALNIVVSVALSWAFNATLRTVPSDTTAEADYV